MDMKPASVRAMRRHAEEAAAFLRVLAHEARLAVLVAHARALGVTVVTGRFRAEMAVELVNEGPVTLLLDTRRLF